MLLKASAITALVAPTLAQNFTSCNPTEKVCPADPALGKAVAYDFASGAPSSDFVIAAGKAPVFSSDGAHFTIAQDSDAPAIASNWYMMFGHYKIVLKPAPGVGIVSSLVLLSNDLDEIDWERIGSQTGKVQTTYFGKGNTTISDRYLTLNDGTSDDGFNTYELDWTADHIQWIINGNVIRTLTPATADYNQYPQTPMQLRIGNWAAGDSSSSATSQWAGGPVQWSQGPFDMVVKTVEVSDYSTGTSYSYSGTSGAWQSILSNGGTISGSGNSGSASSVTTPSASGSTIVASSTVVAITNDPVPTTTTSGSISQLGSSTGAGSQTTSSFSGSADISTSSTLASVASTVSSGSGSRSSGSGSRSTSLPPQTLSTESGLGIKLGLPLGIVSGLVVLALLVILRIKLRRTTVCASITEKSGFEPGIAVDETPGIAIDIQEQLGTVMGNDHGKHITAYR